MSEINDVDLESVGATADERIASRESVVVKSPRGVGAIRAIWGSENRARVIFAAVAFLALVGVLCYLYFSVTPNDAQKVGGGITTGGNARTVKNNKPSEIQKDEADRFNTEQLPELQKVDPTVHPVVTTSDEDDDDFKEQRSFNKPARITNSGSTTNSTENIKEEHGPSTNRQNVVYSKDLMDVAAKLMDEEGNKEPKLKKVSWSYGRPSGENSDLRNRGLASGSVGTPGYSDGASLTGNIENKCKNPIIRAGRQYLARATIALNSDVGGPVILELLNGPLRSQRLTGQFERKDEWLRMDLTKLVGKNDPKQVKAIGLDMETVLNAVGGDVDYHTMYRYGWWGFGATLSALGKAAQLNANTSTTYIGDSVVQDTKSSTSRELKVAAGDLGQSIGEVFKDRIDRPLTVSLKVNDQVGVVFMDDVCGDK